MTNSKKTTEYERLGEPEPAFVSGWPRDINQEQGTARLDAYVNRGVPLRFDASLAKEMLRLEGKFVEVKGRGWICEQEDEWIVVIVEDITCPGEEFLAKNPNRKVFDPDNIVRASFDFDAEEFNRTINEDRDLGRREPSE